MSLSQIRRLSLIAAAALLCGGPAAARERPATAPAARFVQDTGDRAMELARPPVSHQAGGDLAALIGNAIDWPELVRFAVGRHRPELDAEAMSGAAAKLGQRLEALCRRAGIDFPGLTVAVHDLQLGRDGTRRVLATAIVPRFGEVEVGWIVVPTPVGYRIADIEALGLTLRQVLRGWIAGLVAAHGGNAAAAFGDGAATAPQ